MFESDSGILTSHSGYGSSDYSSRMSEEWVIRYHQPPVELSTILRESFHIRIFVDSCTGNTECQVY